MNPQLLRSDGAKDDTRGPMLTVVPVSGSAASGATRLVRTLGETSGFFLAGDIRKVWTRGARDNRECGCGHAFLDCPFWREVGEIAFGGWSRVDVQRVNHLVQEVHSLTGVTKLLVSGARDAAMARYGQYMNRLLAAISELTGSRVILCSAKNPYQGWFLGRLADARVRWVHVVRDPRDTAWLWTVGKVEMKHDDWLPTSTAGIVYKWGRYNLIPPVLSGIGNLGYLRIRLEDLTADPESTLAGVLRFIGAPKDLPEAIVEDHSLMMLDRDTTPCRLVEVDLRHQDEADVFALPEAERWRQGFPRAAQAAVSAATLPMMAAFGYRRRGQPHRDAAPRPSPGS